MQESRTPGVVLAELVAAEVEFNSDRVGVAAGVVGAGEGVRATAWVRRASTVSKAWVTSRVGVRVDGEFNARQPARVPAASRQRRINEGFE